MTEFTPRQRVYSNQNWWDKFWKDDRGRVVIWQNPSPLLYAWLVFTFASLLTNSTTANVFWWIAGAVLALWALLEIFKGADYFRRLLGLVVLAMIFASIFKVGY